MEQAQKITVETSIHASIDKVWDCWTQPEHITKWNNASDDWHTPSASNDLRNGGVFSYRMEAKDGSMGFDFGGIYDEVIKHEFIGYTIGDGRKVAVSFLPEKTGVKIIEVFEAENMHPAEMQQAGWQAILDNFKRHTESI